MSDTAPHPPSSADAQILGAVHMQALQRVMPMALFNPQGVLVYANALYIDVIGVGDECVIGRAHHSFCPEQFAQSPQYQAFWSQLCAGETFSGVVERLKSNGEPCWLEATYTPIKNAQGQVEHVLKVATDITLRRLAEQGRQEHLRLLSLVANASDTAVMISDETSHIMYVNAGFTRMLGWSANEAIGKAPIALLAPQLPLQFHDDYHSSLRTGQAVRREEIVTGKDGQRYWVKAMSNPVLDADGAWRYTITVLTDITPHKIHEALQRSVLEAMARDKPLAEVLELVCREVERIAPEVAASILEVDDNGVLHALAGPSLPASYSSVIDGLSIGPSVGSCGTAAWRKAPVQVDDIATDPLWAQFKDLVLPLGYRACWSTPFFNSEGQVIGTFAFYYKSARSEASAELHQLLVNACTHLCSLALERDRARAQIRRLAFYDGLTGLPNRSLLLAKADQAIASAGRNNEQLAVLFIDLDRFKQVNDSLGHPAGDEFLCTVAERLQKVLRSSDIAGRLSGDEFVAVLPQCSSDDVADTIERLQKLLAEPLRIGDTVMSASASIGVSMFPADGRDMETLLHRADMAMYQAKSGGRGRFSFFSSEMNRLAQERLALENALREALKEGGLRLHYQPQVDLASGKLYGVEALARWTHPVLGEISPVRFIPLAEECGLIADLGRWAIQEACRQLSEWRAKGLPVPAVSVNLSPSNFHNLELPHMISSTLADHALTPEDLTLELTESILLDTNPSTMETIHAVHAQGVRLSMDDFGTGYSSLSYLRRLPVSELKLDRSFVADLEDDEAARALSEAILGIGKSLQLTVVAEGVETPQQHVMLRDQGYPVAQGFLFGKPLQAQDLERWLHDAVDNHTAI